jgi:glucose-6-phosphate 1-dehydrogenase
VLTYLCPTSNIELKDNTVIVVLGASGDLAKKKTVSSSEKLYQELY